MTSNAVSTRQEAIAARRALQQLQCSSVLVVTSNYHSRRTRDIFAREFGRDGIQVRVVSTQVPGLDLKCWWRSHAGRAKVLLECAKILCTWLHFDLPLSMDLRNRLKIWVERSIP